MPTNPASHNPDFLAGWAELLATTFLGGFASGPSLVLDKIRPSSGPSAGWLLAAERLGLADNEGRPPAALLELLSLFMPAHFLNQATTPAGDGLRLCHVFERRILTLR